MEDEERQRKLEAGKAKLAEYRQKKAHNDGQKKKKTKKKKTGSEEECVREAQLDPSVKQEVTREGNEASTGLSLTKTLRTGETVRHDQIYTLEPDSEVSTTAEDYSSEVNGCHEMCVRSQEVGDEELCGHVSPLEAELSPSAAGEGLRDQQEIGDTPGAEGVQQLQDFEAALKQRDGIITQLTTNLQQARLEKDEVMREFLQLTEQSQKLQLQFQQLQAADLLQTRQQLVLYQQQLEEKDTQVRGHLTQLEEKDTQVKGHLAQLEEKDTQVKGLQEKVLQMSILQQKLSQVETVTREAEELIARRLQEKDQQIAEQERSLAQHQDDLRASEQRFNDLSEQLARKTHELQVCEAELLVSRQKERLSSTEIMQLMGTVEDMQKRHHQGSQSEGEVLQRAELDATRRLELLRAELDEMYGQQIVQMKQELLARHAEEMEHVVNHHSANTKNITEHHRVELERLRAQWSQSAGEVNALNARLVEVQQRLQEAQVLREKAEQDLTRVSAKNLRLQEQVQESGGAEHSQIEAEQTKTKVEWLHAAVGDLQAQLAAAAQASSELEAKRESEITNYQIKLQMLEREKDAVLDRMAESQEAELERLRTQLLFSHEEELSRLREDLQHESQMNLQNLRAELEQRHHDNIQQICHGYEERLKAAEDQTAMLQQEIAALKNDLSRAEEGSRLEEGSRVDLLELQAEVEELRSCKSIEGSWLRNDAVTDETWERKCESENKLLKETNSAMAEELKSLKDHHETLLKKMEALATENKQADELVEGLRSEIERQKNTFSFAEKNFEVNYQELKEEYAYLVAEKARLEQRLEEQTLQHTALHSLETQLQPVHQGTDGESTSIQHAKAEYEELDGGMVMEKDTMELMRKLQRVEEEELELVEKVEQKEVELRRVDLEKVGLEEQMNQKKAELQTVALERLALLEQVKQKEAELLKVELEKAELEELMEQKGAELLWVELKRVELEEADQVECVAEMTEKALQKEAKLQAWRADEVEMKEKTSALPSTGGELQGAEWVQFTSLQEEGQMPQSLFSTNQEGVGLEPIKGLVAPPLSQAASGEVGVEEGRTRELSVCAVAHSEQTHTQSSTAADTHTHDRERLLHTLHKQVNSGNVHRSGVSEPRQTYLAMEGSEHDECRLQMEAQRISLCQIHTAQLELLQESLHTHAHTQTQEALEWLQVETTDVPKSSRYQCFMKEVTEDCTQLIQSFSRVLGVELESLQCREVPVEPDLTLQRLETSDIKELLAEAKELYSRLQLLNQCVVSSHQNLLELQASLNTKLGDQTMQREEDFQGFSTSRSTLTRREAEMGSHHIEYAGQQRAGLREELQKQQGVTEEQQVECMRSNYREQSREAEPRDTAQIHLLKDSMKSLSPPTPDQAVQIQLAPGKAVSLGVTAAVSPLLGHSVLQTRFLPGPQQELLSCEGDLSVPEEQQEQQQNREEELAKVIVQMAVEFAQQTELVRIGRLARETSTGTQTVARGALPRGGDVEQLLEELSWREEEVLLLKQKVEVLETQSTSTEPGTEQLNTGCIAHAQRGDEDEEEEMKRGEEHGGHAMPKLSPHNIEFSAITAERNFLQRANERLRQVLVEVLKTTAAAEETIGQHVEGILETVSRGQQHTDASTESYHVNKTTAGNAGVLSGETETDEGLEISQVMLGEELQLESEEHLLSISTRLQIAVEKLLVAITETTNQLEHARITQTELMREKFRHGEEMDELLRRQDELQERLQEEAATRQRLAQQLHQAEGLIDGYSGERRALEEQVRERVQLQTQLEQELHVTSSRLRELEQERQNVYNQQELLSRQQDAMRDMAGVRELRLVESAGDVAPEADLLEETEKLMKEKVDVERQAEKEHAELLQQVRQLEVELEEQVGRGAELEEVHRLETADLTQKIHALEKQLDNNRRFLDEQAMDREHERDVFQQEIQKLEQQLKSLAKPQSSKEQHHREVEQLRAALTEKSERCSEVLLCSEQLRRDVEERDEELEKQGVRVRELEQALLDSTSGLCRTTQHASMDSMAGTASVSLEVLLQTEREALDRKEKEIVNLEEQLEQFREELQNKSEEVQQLHMQLEIQKKEINTHQQELVTQSNLQTVWEEKDREIALLNEQITKLQLRDTSPDNKEVEELREVVQELEAQVEYLRGEQERLKHNSEEQVEQLNSVIEKLQEELSHIEHKQSTEEEDEQDEPQEEYDELKQKTDELTKKLDMLKADYSAVLSKYESLQVEERKREQEREMEKNREEERVIERRKEKERFVFEMEEALRDRTAALLVAQAQVQALEESAASRVTDLHERVEELEQCVEEKEAELQECRLQVEEAQADAEALHFKVSQLEEKLREKVAAVLVSQAQLEAVQVQTKELHSEALLDKDICVLVDSSAELEVEKLRVQVRGPRAAPMGKVGLLTEKLRELEKALSSMQKDQELQKQLLTSSEEEVQEYKRRLTVLIEMINQLRTRPAEHVTQDSSSQTDELLQEVTGQAAATEEELNCCKELSQKLQDELQLKNAMIKMLQTDLQRALTHGSEVDSSAISELLRELQEVKGEAVATKGDVSRLEEHAQRLQEELQEREMTIVLLKDELQRSSGEVDGSELLQELQEVKGEAAATKEELNSYVERSVKLQDEIQLRDYSITELMDELQQLRAASSQSAQLHSRQRTGRDHSRGKGGGVAKDKPSLSRKNSNTQSETSTLSSTFSANDFEGVSCVDVGTQVERVEQWEEVEEVIGEYTERIAQMQELHAAEIMDMENRHISESESLRRDAQRLEQECSQLRSSISSLRLAETARLEHPTASQFRDGYTSDSSSDWSQRTGVELPHLQEIRSTPEGARRDDPDLLPDRVKMLLREVHQEGMQVLCLSELPVPEVGHPAGQRPLQAWRTEREALIDTVEALKSLITQLQTHDDTQTHTQASADWRAELLGAVQQVFMRERTLLKTTLNTTLISHMDLLETSDTVIHLNQLQKLLTEQDSRQQEALVSLCSAERTSLLAEISLLRSQMQHLQGDTEPALWQHHPVASTGLCEVRSPAGGEGGTGAGLFRRDTDADAGCTARAPELQLKSELAQTKLELETSLKTQHKYLQELNTLRGERSARAQELDVLSDRLLEEQRRVRELQWAAERSMSQAQRRQEGEREEVEDLRMDLQEQQGHVAEMSASLEEERQVSAQLKEERDELQVKLEAQLAQTGELNFALQRQKELSAQLLNQLQHTDSGPDPHRPLQAVSTGGVEQAEASCSQVEEGVRSVEALLQSLQGQLTEKHSTLVELMKQLEQEKLQAVQMKCAWEQERSGLLHAAAHDRSSLQAVQDSLARLEGHTAELQAQLDRERERGMRLEGERERLQQRLSELTERLGRVEGRPQSSSQQVVEGEAEGQLSDRTRDWVLQQKAEEAVTLSPSTAHTAGVSAHALATPTHSNNMDTIVNRLQLIAAKINSMTGGATHRLPMEGPDRECLTWLQSNVQDVMSLLQQVSSVPPAVLESTSLLAGGSSSRLTERLLRQNAELTGFVSRLTKEKNELRNQLLGLEEQLRRRHHLAAHNFSRSGLEKPEQFSSEREAWSRERSRLEQSLRQAEAELSHLRREIRSSIVRDLSVPDMDNAMLRRIYGKFLRAESFRKALIYQKKYLLLLLGGFQECEEATLSLIGRMGGQPTHPCLEPPRYHRRGLTRFRSAVRVSIAISRMRFLVRRWQKATGGSISSPSINRNGLSQIPGRNDSPYLQPASVEVYGERRGTNRGRTGRDSPRSGHSTVHRYCGTVTDGGGLLCSHLQSYDPDRALTDYISRLEALQRRLGSVHSGTSSYAQMHCGLRR
ncbi:A-kinase anchor protein 9 isoform X3 [Brachyhypopomus gauderio]|uniref:A-kinase anchor protein 9 isoform X3 n=1 Tax=Brachyhypopomus gauderio TaxID=698409 RepID=UPI0040422F4C